MEEYLFLHMTLLFSAGRGSFLALSAAGHAGGPRVHPGASVGTRWAPWRLLWAFNMNSKFLHVICCV